MDLLHPDHQKPLTALLSALLMLLPQSEAFNILHKRLQAVPHLAVLESVYPIVDMYLFNFIPTQEHEKKSAQQRYPIAINIQQN